MNDHSPTVAAQSGFAAVPTGLPAAAKTALKLMARITHGHLVVHLPDGSTRHFGVASTAAPQLNTAYLHFKNWNVCSAALKSGDIGFAETYIAGDWSTPNLTDVLTLFIANRREVEDVIYGTWLGRLAYRVKHLLNRNTKANSEKNIHAHYDLGNAFYSLWLDASMNYSSALFEGNTTQDLQQAQHAKVRRALRMVAAKPGDRILEIGCGWGALAEKAALEFGAQVTGVTLSHEQLAFAQKRMAAVLANSATLNAPSGLTSDLRLQDYREIKDGPFDAVCSIEMVEAVGREYWPQYFAAVARALKSGGRACIQSIVIDDALFERYVGSTDFIQQYIFPGGCLPCPSAFRQAANAAGLRVIDEFAFGPDYAQTCKLWREKFTSERPQVLALGFDERFCRIWEFYLAYCEAAFSQANIDVVQYTLEKP